MSSEHNDGAHNPPTTSVKVSDIKAKFMQTEPQGSASQSTIHNKPPPPAQDVARSRSATTANLKAMFEQKIEASSGPPSAGSARPGGGGMGKLHAPMARDKEREKKERVQREFFETEENYYQSLTILVEVYLNEIKQRELLSKEDVDIIFSNIDVIQQMHGTLYNDLRPLYIKDENNDDKGSRVKFSDQSPSRSKPKQQSFGDCLFAFIPFFKMYTQYINSFDRANKRVGDLTKSSKKFESFLNEVKDRPECKKLDLVSFLIMPIQRLPRYELLLRDVLQHTSDRTEYEKIEKCFKAVQTVNQHVNSSKGEQLQRQRLYKLQAGVRHKVDIFSRPDRRLVREGTLWVRERGESVSIGGGGPPSPATTSQTPSPAGTTIIPSTPSPTGTTITPSSSSTTPQTSSATGNPLILSSGNIAMRKKTGKNAKRGSTIEKKEFKEHYFFLFDDFLLVVRRQKEDKYQFKQLFDPTAIVIRDSDEAAASIYGYAPSNHHFAGSDDIFAGGESPLYEPRNSPHISHSSHPTHHPQHYGSGGESENGGDKERAPTIITTPTTHEGEQNVESSDHDMPRVQSSEHLGIAPELYEMALKKEDSALIFQVIDNKKGGTVKKFDLKAKTVQEKEEWIADITKVKEEMVRSGLLAPKLIKEQQMEELERKKKEEEEELRKLQEQKEKEAALYQYDYMFKVIFVPARVHQRDKGDSAIAIAAIVNSLADAGDTAITTKLPFRIRTVKALNGKIVKLQLFTHLNENRLSAETLRGTHGVVVVHDPADADSTRSAIECMEDIRAHSPNVCGLLLGNQMSQPSDPPQPELEIGTDESWGGYVIAGLLQNDAQQQGASSSSAKQQQQETTTEGAAVENPVVAAKLDTALRVHVEKVLKVQEKKTPGGGGASSAPVKTIDLDLSGAERKTKDKGLIGMLKRKSSMGKDRHKEKVNKKDKEPTTPKGKGGSARASRKGKKEKNSAAS